MTELMKKKINNGREYRDMQLEPCKQSEDTEIDRNEFMVEGYATTFNTAYRLYGDEEYELEEIVDKEAFKDCDTSDVIFQYDHEGRVYARTSNRTLELSEDDKGLKIKADLGGTKIGRSLYEEIKGGYTNKMSFGFIVGDDKINKRKEGKKTVITRTITKINKLFDVSAVSLPANDMTSISARKFSDGVIEELKTERLKRVLDINKLNLEIELLKQE